MAQAEEIISKIEGERKVDISTLEFVKVAQQQSRGAQTIEDEENKGILEMRKRWANWVLFFIGLIVVFDMILIYFIGMGIWTFQNPAIVIVIITDNFLKIIGLGLLIAKSIFKKIFSK